MPPDEYWPLIKQVCDKYGVLLIHDEVITGFGRTGKWFGGMNWGVVPDIMTMAKGISSAYVPLAATAVSDEVFDGFKGDPAENVQFNQISTYGGHPVACAVGCANLQLMEDLNLVENAATVGDHLHQGLRTLKGRHGIVGDVRGKGLLYGLELVQPGSIEPLPAAQVGQVMAEAAKRGLLVGKNVATVPRLECVITLSPPLILTATEADRSSRSLTRRWGRCRCRGTLSCCEKRPLLEESVASSSCALPASARLPC